MPGSPRRTTTRRGHEAEDNLDRARRPGPGALERHSQVSELSEYLSRRVSVPRRMFTGG